MHFKKLIVSGFKSFADKVVLHFDEGITGIVGPNGSGKSNVIDAVRWVMGEQNAKYLRGQVATDIIFAGSDKRKAMTMAEVTLVFDNRDASPFCPPEYRHEPEISLTRRLYSHGEREYFINRKRCRLKDIVNFFATTGLGGRSYSMIQQGQVDRILNAKPEDVREILEEAAGTTVFKTRRDAALKKLQSTEENLSRIEDIVIELDRQLETLKEQVDKAREWQRLSAELKDQELSLFAHNFYHFTGKLQTLSQQLDRETDEEIKRATDISHAEARIEALQLDLAEADPDLEALREDVSNLREQIARAESTIKSAEESLESNERRLLEIDENFQHEKSELDELREQVEKAQDIFDGAHEGVEKARDMVETLAQEVEQIEESARVFSSRSQDLEQEIISIDRQLDSNGLRCEAIDRERSRISAEVEQSQSRLDELQDEQSGYEMDIGEAQAALDEKQAAFDEIALAKQSIEDRLQELDQELNDARQQREQVKERFMGSRARHESLLELESQLEDVSSTMERLLEAEPQNRQHTLGLLPDFISFSEDFASLDLPARKAFESWSERVLLRHFADTQTLAQALHRQELGQVAVSVLPAPLGPEVKQRLESLGMQSFASYLNIQENADSAIQQLLNHLFLADGSHLDADQLENLPTSVVIFTRDGRVFANSNHFLVGYENVSSALSRKDEMLSLREQMDLDQATVGSLEQQIARCQEDIRTGREELRSYEESLKERNKNSIDALSRLQSLRQSYEHTSELIDDARQRFDNLKARDRDLMQELSELGEARISLGQQKDEIRAEIESLQLEFESIEDRRSETQKIYQRHQLELAKLEAQAENLKSNFSQNQERLQRLEATVTRRLQERQAIEAQVEGAHTRKAQSHQEMETYLIRREELEEELQVRREKSADLVNAIREEELKLKKLRSEQDSLQKNHSQNRIEVERLREASKSLLEQAEEKYHVNLLEYRLDYKADFSADEVSKQVQSLRRKIEALGGINMVAIDEYERLSERHQFITAQREEVIGSILLLEEAIAEIEETSKERFLGTFDIINENFQSLFPILFPGGEARLELSDRDDVLNAGVEIMVRMPGKTPRSMTLYSGGEKALTAISLIFALLKTKPTPFCFLDEVDAPLDEANVGRYNKVLDALSDRFQFIVITHNRRTMEVLDQLYGVTMQEGGVSTVVGVDMRKDLPDHLKKAFEKPENQNRVLEGATTQ